MRWTGLAIGLLLGLAGCDGPIVAELPGMAVLPPAQRIGDGPGEKPSNYAYCADRLADQAEASRPGGVSRFCNCVTNTAPLYVPAAEWQEIENGAAGDGIDSLPPVARQVARACRSLALR